MLKPRATRCLRCGVSERFGVAQTTVNRAFRGCSRSRADAPGSPASARSWRAPSAATSQAGSLFTPPPARPWAAERAPESWRSGTVGADELVAPRLDVFSTPVHVRERVVSRGVPSRRQLVLPRLRDRRDAGTGRNRSPRAAPVSWLPSASASPRTGSWKSHLPTCHGGREEDGAGIDRRRCRRDAVVRTVYNRTTEWWRWP